MNDPGVVELLIIHYSISALFDLSDFKVVIIREKAFVDPYNRTDERAPTNNFICFMSKSIKVKFSFHLH